MSGEYTPAQEQTLKRAFDMLSEHFDHVVVAVATDIEHQGKSAELSHVFFSGGRMAALGLCVVSKERVESCKLADCEPT